MNDAFGKRFGLSPRYAARGTDRVAGRALIVFQSIKAEIALYRCFLDIIILHGAEGTGFQTLFAPDAQVFIYQNQAYFVS